MNDIIKILLDEINHIRNIKEKINFIQIGAYDGISMNDIGNIILNNNDIGLFIEPNPFILNELIENKKTYLNSKILSFAVIPDENFYHQYFHVHKNGGGSSFVRGLYNGEYSPDTNFEVMKVETITVENLWKTYVNFSVDVLITDCEGYDFDINKKVLEICKPKIIYMEAWDTGNLNFNQKITTRNDMFSFMKENNYNIFFEKKDENLICILNEKNY